MYLSKGVEYTEVPADKHWYERRKHGMKGGYTDEELADDPDFDTRLDMDYSDIHENGENNG